MSERKESVARDIPVLKKKYTAEAYNPSLAYETFTLNMKVGEDSKCLVQKAMEVMLSMQLLL